MKKIKKYVQDPTKSYYKAVNLFGGPNRFAIRIEKDPKFWKNRKRAKDFKADWPQYFDKVWREENYGEDFVWEDLE